jgi:hypothetical protein
MPNASLDAQFCPCGPEAGLVLGQTGDGKDQGLLVLVPKDMDRGGRIVPGAACLWPGLQAPKEIKDDNLQCALGDDLTILFLETGIWQEEGHTKVNPYFFRELRKARCLNEFRNEILI